MNQSQTSSTNEKILIVDDQENNRLVIEDILKKFNFNIKGVSSAEEALKMVNHWTPDVVLMDLMMPGMNGIEAVKHLKLRPEFEHIPILMITAKNEMQTLKDAFEAGAVDFLHKPVERIALVARVMSALRTKHAFDEVRKLTKILTLQKQELSNFTHMVSHDLKSPAASAASLFDFFLYRLREEYPELWKDENLQDLLVRVPLTLKKMLRFIDTMLSYATAGIVIGKIENSDMNTVLEDVLSYFRPQLDQQEVVFTKSTPFPKVNCDPVKIAQVWQNLISNAIKYRGDKKTVAIELGFNETATEFIFWVKDDGPGIPKEHHDKIFNPFVRLHDDVEGSGIGLATVKKVLDSHHGKIYVDSENSEGAKFNFHLPK